MKSQHKGTSPATVDGAACLCSDGLVTIPDAAAFLSLSRSRVYELLAAGLLPSAKIGGARRIPRRALVAFSESMLERVR